MEGAAWAVAVNRAAGLRYTGAVRFALPLLALLLPLSVARAAPFAAPVSAVGFDADVRRVLADAASTAEALLTGDGERLVLTYSAASPLDVLIFPHADGPPDIAAALRATVPAGRGAQASFDLTRSPSWRPGERSYDVHVLTSDAAGATVHVAAFEGGGALRVPVILLRQLLALPPLRIAAYHRLPAYRAFGTGVTMVLGLLLLAVSGGILVLRRSAAPVLAGVALLAILLYGLRSSLDLGRYAVVHAQRWNGGTYADAGSAYAVADVIRAEGVMEGTVLSCGEGTSYLPTLLRYLLYPVRVETALPRGPLPAFAVVPARVGARADKPGSIACAGTTLSGSLLRTFPDGTALYRLAPAR